MIVLERSGTLGVGDMFFWKEQELTLCNSQI